jgi:hypothetical protein
MKEIQKDSKNYFGDRLNEELVKRQGRNTITNSFHWMGKGQM